MANPNLPTVPATTNPAGPDPLTQTNPQRPATYDLQQVPAGGRILKADPTPTNATPARRAEMGTPTRPPFRVRGG
jgi:hypothetical protein